jgi:hypothetical protein
MIYSIPKEFTSEQDFKTWFLQNIRDNEPDVRVFPIETEETVPGFPDVVVFGQDRRAKLYEFKYADKNGVITFRKTQSRFFILTEGFASIDIVAYDRMCNVFHIFPAKALFTPSSPYYMTKQLQVVMPR